MTTVTATTTTTPAAALHRIVVWTGDETIDALEALARSFRHVPTREGWHEQAREWLMRPRVVITDRIPPRDYTGWVARMDATGDSYNALEVWDEGEPIATGGTAYKLMEGVDTALASHPALCFPARRRHVWTYDVAESIVTFGRGLYVHPERLCRCGALRWRDRPEQRARELAA